MWTDIHQNEINQPCFDITRTCINWHTRDKINILAEGSYGSDQTEVQRGVIKLVVGLHLCISIIKLRSVNEHDMVKVDESIHIGLIQL